MRARERKRNVNYPTVHPAEAAGWGGDAQPARVGHPQKETRGKIRKAARPPITVEVNDKDSDDS